MIAIWGSGADPEVHVNHEGHVDEETAETHVDEFGDAVGGGNHGLVGGVELGHAC